MPSAGVRMFTRHWDFFFNFLFFNTSEPWQRFHTLVRDVKETYSSWAVRRQLRGTGARASSWLLRLYDP